MTEEVAVANSVRVFLSHCVTTAAGHLRRNHDRVFDSSSIAFDRMCLRLSFAGVTASMKNGVFWDVTPCASCKNRRFEGT
jgi:hypothetical protein